MIYDLQRASMWKRISAFLFDGIMLTVVAVLMALLLSTALGYDGYQAQVEAGYAKYGEEYGVNFNMSLEEFEAMTPQDTQRLEKAFNALSADSAVTHAYEMVIQLTILVTSIGIFLGFVIWEFTIPMLLGNGQTLGKKIFGLGVMHVDGIRITGPMLFIRSILGKYAIETMVPVFIVFMVYFGSIGVIAPIILLGLMIVQAALMFTTKERSLIHDKLACTVAVDIASQMIFKDRDAMMAYKQKKHAEAVAQMKEQ